MSFKQFIKLLVISLPTWGLCFALLKVLNGCIAPVLEETLGAFVVVALFSSALSFALFTFVDGIIKDVASFKEQFDLTKYNSAIEGLARLKKEILSNAFLILILFLIERISKGAMIAINDETLINFQFIPAILLSLRIACFLLSFIAVISQFRGFMIASDYRSLVSRIKK